MAPAIVWVVATGMPAAEVGTRVVGVDQQVAEAAGALGHVGGRLVEEVEDGVVGGISRKRRMSAQVPAAR